MFCLTAVSASSCTRHCCLSLLVPLPALWHCYFHFQLRCISYPECALQGNSSFMVVFCFFNSWYQSLPWKSIMHVYDFPASMYVHHMCPVPSEVRGGHYIPWNQSYGCLGTSMWVLGAEEQQVLWSPGPTLLTQSLPFCWNV